MIRPRRKIARNPSRKREAAQVDGAGPQELQRLTRNAIALDDADLVIEAEEGFIDVFAVASGEFGAPGALHHLLRAGPNQPLPGGVTPPAGVERFLAVPGPGALWSACSRKDWLEAHQDEDAEDVIDELTDALWEWAAEAPAVPGPGQDPLALEPEETLLATQGAACACDYGMVAIRLKAGRLAYQGREAAVLESGELAFVSRHGWCRVVEDAEIEVQALSDCENLAAGFAAYCVSLRLMLRAGSAALDADEQAGSARLRARVHGIERGLDAGLLQMQKLLDPDATAPERELPGTGAIHAAARRVGERAGIEFRELGEAPAEPAAYVSALADASGVRSRAVTLSGEWWKRDAGPLLAFRAEDDGPLALLPERGGRYVAHDPVTGAESRVDAALAAGLKPYAYTFYRPFPHQPIGVLDLVRHGLRGQGRELGPIVAFAALIALLGLLVPIVTAELVDQVIPSAQTSVLMQLGLVLLAAALVHSLFSLARGLFLLRVQDGMEQSIQAAVWDRVLALPIDFFRDYAVGDLAMRVNAVNVVNRMLSVGTLTGLLGGSFALLNLVVLFRFSAPLALLVLALVVGAAVALYVAFKVTLKRLDALIPSQRRVMALVFQLVQGVAKLRTTASEARAFGLWAEEFARFRAVRFLILKLQAQQQVFFAGYHQLAMLVVFVTMAALLARPGGSGMSAGEFVGFFAAFTALLIGVMGICETAVGLLIVTPLFKMAAPLLQALPETAEGKTAPGRIAGAIEVSQVGFTYPDGDEVLDDVSFSVPAGSFTAIVGPSGSGKSTLLRLLLGFDAPGSGAILYDDKNLQDIDQRALRRQFGVVLQGSPLMAGDIFSNIVGVSGGTIDDAWEAARLAGLEEDIQAMPMGMHTAIGEGTSTLSGGQRQRILIARALVGRPRVLFLDEATSALDNRSQALVSDSLLRMKATRIVIAHRLSTIAQADQIVVLEEGRVVQCGTYAELIREKGLFADLAQRQSLDE